MAVVRPLGPDRRRVLPKRFGNVEHWSVDTSGRFHLHLLPCAKPWSTTMGERADRWIRSPLYVGSSPKPRWSGKCVYLHKRRALLHSRVGPSNLDCRRDRARCPGSGRSVGGVSPSRKALCKVLTGTPSQNAGCETRPHSARGNFAIAEKASEVLVIVDAELVGLPESFKKLQRVHDRVTVSLDGAQD
jgi:hypothetical protein